MNENIRRCIDEFDKYRHSKRGALCIANNIGIEISLDHINEVADRRNHPDYLGLSDEEVFATTLNIEQMVNFNNFFRQVHDLPAELIRPFRPAEVTEIIESPTIIESLAS